MEKITRSVDETFAFAVDFAAQLRPGSVVALHGSLGAGKTLFSRGVACGLGVTDAVTSPTFTILQEYALPDGARLCHFDLYRISGTEAAYDFGMDEYLAEPSNICLIEWSERAPELLPAHTLHVTLELIGEPAPGSDESRRITVSQWKNPESV